jgi:succinate dehydrogenase / fumarate reductase flavoprotein subunit
MMGESGFQKKIEDVKSIKAGKLKPTEISEKNRDYYLERRYPAFGNLVPRDVASRAAKERIDEGFGVNKTGEAVYLDFSSAIERYGKQQAAIDRIKNPTNEEIISLGEKIIESKYGNLFQMYEKIVAENPYKNPMMIYPAVHYTMGGVWVDYNLMTTVPGCYCIGEANFSDHGANRLGASALMQGLADGYFVLPYTIGDYLAHEITTGAISNESEEFLLAEKAVTEKLDALLEIKGSKSPDYFHKRLGKVMWENVGMSRNKKGLENAIQEIKLIKDQFWKDLRVLGDRKSLNAELEKAGRVADLLELGELFAKDALNRNESCGGHFREESVELDGVQKGEAKRNDKDYSYVSAWEFNGDPSDAILHKEYLEFNDIELKQRSYK